MKLIRFLVLISWPILVVWGGKSSLMQNSTMNLSHPGVEKSLGIKPQEINVNFTHLKPGNANIIDNSSRWGQNIDYYIGSAEGDSKREKRDNPDRKELYNKTKTDLHEIVAILEGAEAFTDKQEADVSRVCVHETVPDVTALPRASVDILKCAEYTAKKAKLFIGKKKNGLKKYRDMVDKLTKKMNDCEKLTGQEGESCIKAVQEKIDSDNLPYEIALIINEINNIISMLNEYYINDCTSDLSEVL